MFADKGYLSKALLERLRQRGLHLITGVRRSRKNSLLPLPAKVLLRNDAETLFVKIKSSMGLGHTGHRSPANALVHILSCLSATTLAQPHPEHLKPCLTLSNNWGFYDWLWVG